MKKYVNLFYTRIFKCTVIVVLTVLTWITSGYVTDIFTLQIKNRAALENVFVQPFSFDYESSRYLKAEIENTVDHILDYSLDYSRDFSPDEHLSYEEYNYYMSLSNAKYKATVEYLGSLRGVNFAVVNHSTDKIISNVAEIHSKPSSTEIRHLFAAKEHPFIIIRNCSNPYYEQDSLPGYVDHVRKKASEYSDSCDLYISFTDGLCFREAPSYYEDMHNEYSDKVFFLIKRITVFSLISLLLICFLVKVTGRAEKGGKVIPAFSDHLPSDLIIFFYLTIIASIATLYHTSLYMIYKTSTIDGYGLGFRPETYAFRADVTLVITVYVLCALLCKIKRQKLLGTLYSGSYICLIRNMLKKRKEEDSKPIEKD